MERSLSYSSLTPGRSSSVGAGAGGSGGGSGFGHTGLVSSLRDLFDRPVSSSLDRYSSRTAGAGDRYGRAASEYRSSGYMSDMDTRPSYTSR